MTSCSEFFQPILAKFTKKLSNRDEDYIEEKEDCMHTTYNVSIICTKENFGTKHKKKFSTKQNAYIVHIIYIFFVHTIFLAQQQKIMKRCVFVCHASANEDLAIIFETEYAQRVELI